MPFHIKNMFNPLKMDRSNAEIEALLDQAFPVTTGSLLSDALHNLTRPSISISHNNNWVK